MYENVLYMFRIHGKCFQIQAFTDLSGHFTELLISSA